MSSIEKKQFEANISELMNLIINSFYSNRDIFLRELISNASDAIDKQRHYDLKNGVVDKIYEIKIDPFANENCLVIQDNGVGMDEADLISHLSTIATSGTKEFVRSLSEKTDQIGQFGVGFYSAFLVADNVDVYTRKQGGDVFKWTSDANQYYTIENVSPCVDFCEHGTRIILKLKEDCKEFLEESTLRRIVSHHSSFILYPILLQVEKSKEAPVEEEGAVVEEEGAVVEEEGAVEEEEKSKAAPKMIQYKEWEKINGDCPIWYKNSNEVSNEDYEALYKVISKDWEKPLFWRHFKTEGAYEFRGILFIPSKTPFDLLGDRIREKRNIKLYVKKVLVLNELDKEMLPDWMNFVVGVLDSADLPLNVSREMLQQNKIVKAMKNQLKKQVMNMMNDIFSNDDLYSTFYQNFHRNIKLGIHEGDDSLLSFLKIKNSKNDSLLTLDNYIEEYKKDDDQKSIYYITGSESKDSLFSKLYSSKGYTVLYFDEPIDEFMLQRVNKYKEYDLVNICKDHTTPWQSESVGDEESVKSFLEWVKTSLDDSNVETVRISSKLTTEEDDPLCVLSSKWGWSGNMEKIMQSQPLGDNKNMLFMKGKRILELNIGNPTIQALVDNYQSNAGSCQNQIKILYNCGLLSAGFPIENTTSFVSNIYKSLQTSTITV